MYVIQGWEEYNIIEKKQSETDKLKYERKDQILEIKTDLCVKVFKELTFFDIKYPIERKGKWMQQNCIQLTVIGNDGKIVWKVSESFPIRNESSIFMIFVLHH